MGGLNGNDELEALLSEARQHEAMPSLPAQGRAWAGIQRRLVVGPPPIPIERFSLVSAAGGGKLILLIAVITWVSATVLGGVAATVVVDGEASGAPQVATRTVPEEKEPRNETSDAMVAASEVPFVVHEDEPIVLDDDDDDVVEITGGERPRPAARGSARQSSDLAAETRMLRGAQTLLRSGSIAEATALLSAHRRQFPRGLLVDLRAALEIDALCRRGEHARAQSLLRSFAQRYPNSPYRARVQACGMEVTGR